MERPRLFLLRKETNSLDYVEVLVTKISGDAKGISYLELSLDPDPNARYRIILAKIMDVADLRLLVIWTCPFPHLTSGVYQGFRAGDTIAVLHRSTDVAITVASTVSLAFNEVVP